MPKGIHDPNPNQMLGVLTNLWLMVLMASLYSSSEIYKKLNQEEIKGLVPFCVLFVVAFVSTI
jgi:hypothetical protein